jgi:hypothetical protein
VLSVNGYPVVNVDHYEAVEVLKQSGYKLVLVVTREVPRLVPVTTKVYHSDFVASNRRAACVCVCVCTHTCTCRWYISTVSAVTAVCK